MFFYILVLQIKFVSQQHILIKLFHENVRECTFFLSKNTPPWLSVKSIREIHLQIKINDKH